MLKATYGTGCFALLNTGAHDGASANRAAHDDRLPARRQTTYALEGSIFIAGAAVQWLRDGLARSREAGETRSPGRSAPIPTPASISCRPSPGSARRYWDAEARGAIFGLTRGPPPPSSPAPRSKRRLPDPRPARGDARGLAGRPGARRLRVDGGMTANDWLLQRLADILGAPVDRPRIRRPRRSARPSSPAKRAASMAPRTNCNAPGCRRAPLSPPWGLMRGRRAMPAGSKRSRR